MSDLVERLRSGRAKARGKCHGCEQYRLIFETDENGVCGGIWLCPDCEAIWEQEALKEQGDD